MGKAIPQGAKRVTGLVIAAATMFAGAVAMAQPGTAQATVDPVDPAKATTATDVQVIAFQQNWNTIADECTSTYGPEGVAYVEVSPPQESIQGTEWWTSYQPVSYKLDSKLGTEEEFVNMIQQCKAAGVGIIADVVLNQTTGSDVADETQYGTGGTEYNGETATYPGFTGTDNQYPDGVTIDDFHDYENYKNISDYTNQQEVQEGRLSSMWDFNSESEKVQDIQSDYLAYLYNLGVEGFRMDAVKHINADSIAAIKDQMAQKVGVDADDIYWIQEVIGNSSEAAGIQPYNYFDTGTVTQFDYKSDLNQKFRSSIADLKDLSTRIGDQSSNKFAIPSDLANVFVTNWDTERNEGTITYKDGATYQLANAFMLAYDYGTPRLISDYKWDDADDGAPGATEDSVPDVDMDEACSTNGGDWNCQERWTSTRGMIGFHNVVDGTEVTDWQDDGANNIAFSRGEAGFIAINNSDEDYDADYTTTVPDGTYCNVYGSMDCSATVTVKDGKVTTTIPAGSAIAIHVAATEDSHLDSDVATDPSDPDLTVVADETLPSDTTMTIYYKNPNGYEQPNIYYGVGDDWSAATNIPMTDLGDGYWSYDIKTGGKSAQICFNDGGSNWDNNNGANYVIAKGVTKATVTGVGAINYDDPYPEAQQTRLVVHYKAPENDPERSLWIWKDAGNGDDLPSQFRSFTGTDCWGQVAEYTFDGQYDSFGLIIATSDWGSKVGNNDRIVSVGADGTAEVWIDGTNYVDAATGPETQTTAPSDYACKASSVDLTVHYYRSDGLYYNASDDSVKVPQWDMWLWNSNTNGFSSKFTKHDGFGEIATATFKNYTASISDSGLSDFGLIRRYGTDSWAAKDPDGNDYKIPADAIVYDAEIGTAKAEIWLKQDDATVYTAQPNQASSITSAEIATMNTITGKFSNNADLTADDVTVTDGDGNKVAVTDVAVDGTKLTVTTDGDLDVKGVYTVDCGSYGVAKAVAGAVVRTDAFDDEYAYDGDDLGATWSADSTTFKVWAPTATDVKLVTFENDTTADAAEKEAVAMEAQDDGVWAVTVKGDLADTAYIYRLTFADGTVNDSRDPYATAAVVNGGRSVVLADDQTDVDGFERMESFSDPSDAVVAETHIRDLTKNENSGVSEANRGKYLGMVEEGTVNSNGTSTGVDYLKDLGITHLQIQPFFDYASVDETADLDDSNYNWGYDPENYNVPEGSYSSDATDPSTRIVETKEMVQGLHDNGIRVVMDVVYNHVADQSSSAFNLTVPGYYFRYDDNGNLVNNSGCGNDTASERTMMRNYIVNSVKYWASEYNVDGFRFDLMGLEDLETMQAVRDALDEIDPSILIIGEGWDMNTTMDKSEMSIQPNAYELNGDESTVSFFNDSIRDGLKGSVFSAEDTGFVSGKEGTEKLIVNNMLGCQNGEEYAGATCNNGNADAKYANASQVVQYVEIHDNLTLYDKLRASNGDDSEETTVKRAELADSAIFLANGISEFQIGQEFLRTKGGDENSYKSGDSVNAIDWDRLDDGTYGASADYVKGLIALRKDTAAFRTSNYDTINANSKVLQAADGVVAYQIADESGTYVVMLNANDEAVEVPQAQGGDYQVLVEDGEVYSKATSSASASAATDEAALSSAVFFEGSADVSATAQKEASTVSIDDGGSYTVPALSATVLYNPADTGDDNTGDNTGDDNTGDADGDDTGDDNTGDADNAAGSAGNGSDSNGSNAAGSNASGSTSGNASASASAGADAAKVPTGITQLASTGSSIGLVIAVMAALVAVGALMLGVSRRSQGRHSDR